MTHPHGHSPGATADWLDHANQALAEAGHRAGGARAAVLAALASQSCCRTAQDVFDNIRGGGQRVGIASVYRVLDLLVGRRLVLRLDLGDGVSRFEPALPDGHHHHHLVCTDCGEVTPFEDPALEKAIDATGRRSSFAISEHDVVLRGHCPDCTDSRTP